MNEPTYTVKIMRDDNPYLVAIYYFNSLSDATECCNTYQTLNGYRAMIYKEEMHT